MATRSRSVSASKRFQHALCARAEVDAPLVFVGYGLNIPEQGYDDFAGLDLKGKVAVLLTGSPAEIPSAVSAHYQSRAERWKMLKAAGAIGMITIPNPASMEMSWSRMALNRYLPSMDLVGPEFDETAGSSARRHLQSCVRRPAFRGDRLYVCRDCCARQRPQGVAAFPTGNFDKRRHPYDLA